MKIRVGKFVEADLDDVAAKCGAELVAELGRTALFWKKRDEESSIEIPE